MTHNNSVDRASKAPENIVDKAWERKAHHILDKHTRLLEEILNSELDSLASDRIHYANDELDNSCRDCSQCNTDKSKLRKSEKSENKCSVDKYIDKK